MRFLKKAEMSIYGAIVAFALILLMFPMFELYQVNRSIDKIDNQMIGAFNNVTIIDSRERFDNVKFEKPGVIVNNTDEYLYSALNSIGFKEKDGVWSRSVDNMLISNPSIKYNSDNLTYTVRYTVNVRFKLLGINSDKLNINKQIQIENKNINT